MGVVDWSVLLFDNFIGRKRNVDGGCPCGSRPFIGFWITVRNIPTVTYFQVHREIDL